MGRTIFDISQIVSKLIAAKTLADLSVIAYEIDELSYVTTPAEKYVLEGSLQFSGANGGLTITSGAVAGNRGRIDKSTQGSMFSVSQDYDVVFKVGVNNPTNVRSFVGVMDVVPTAAVPPVEPAEAAYFRAISAGAAANWFAVSRNADVETAVDTGILANSTQRLMRVSKSNGVIRYFIDDVLVAKITTNLAELTNFFPGHVFVTQEAVAKSQASLLFAWFAKRF